MREALFEPDFLSWRRAARELLRDGVPPSEILWRQADAGQQTLNGLVEPPPADSPEQFFFRVPKAFMEIAPRVACHRAEARWPLLYRMLFRLTHGEPRLLENEVDWDVREMLLLDQAVRRDAHKMIAFVRFRRVRREDGGEYVAWYRPDHYVLPQAARFFARRFREMKWAVLTPDRSAYWDLRQLRYGPGVPRSRAPAGDELEDLWRTYYASIFNPARVKVKVLKSLMPVRYWPALPEAEVIPELIANARGRVQQMQMRQPGSAEAFVRAAAEPSIAGLRAAARHCQGCPLFRHASQTVFGEGPPDARLVLVGEQPGDTEDLSGRPFAGSAGEVLDQALETAGIDRRLLYVTNAVKHFKFVERGKRRIHQKPAGVEVAACRPWLEAEIAAIKPELIVALGATAAQSLTGRAFHIMSERGQFMEHRWAPAFIATIHPSALLRIMEPERREAEYGRFLADLRLVSDRMRSGPPPSSAPPGPVESPPPER